MPNSRSGPRAVNRIGPALISGGIAIVINTFALKAADLISLPTARGGLLRLISPWFAPSLQASGGASLWFSLGGPAPGTPIFGTGFHLAVGLLMALFYAFALEPVLPGGALRRGLIYAIVVWLLNAAIVLPLTGEGFAGSTHLTIAGMLWFAAAHTLFFVILALGYDRLKPAYFNVGSR